MYGYQIAKQIKIMTNDTFQIGEGTLYPALKRLEEKMYLYSYWVSVDSNIKRKYYKTTEEGKIDLYEKIKSMETIISLIYKINESK